MADFQKWQDEGNDAAAAKDYEKALSCFQKALESNPEFTIALHSMGVAYGKLEQFDKALECLDKRLVIDKFDTGLLNQKGITLHRMKRYDDAIKVYDQMIEIDDLNTTPWINKGIVYELQDQLEKAIECYHNALKINPKKKLAWTNKKIAYSNQGMTEEAKECEKQENKLEDDKVTNEKEDLFQFAFNRQRALSMRLHTPDEEREKAAYLHRKRLDFKKDKGLTDHNGAIYTTYYELWPAYLYVANCDYDKTPLNLDELAKVSNVSKEKIIADAEIILEDCQQIKEWKILVPAEEFELFTDKKNIEIKDKSIKFDPNIPDIKEKCPRCVKGTLVTDHESGEMLCPKCGFVLKKDL